MFAIFPFERYTFERKNRSFELPDMDEVRKYTTIFEMPIKGFLEKVEKLKSLHPKC